MVTISTAAPQTMEIKVDDPYLQGKLEALGYEPVSDLKGVRIYNIPHDRLQIFGPRARLRHYTAEQRKEIRERLVAGKREADKRRVQEILAEHGVKRGRGRPRRIAA